MDSKQLVALWYGGTAIVIARLVFAVSGVSIAISLAVVLVVLAVPIVRAHHRAQAERQGVSVGAPLLIGPLVLGVVLVAQWRAQSVVTIAPDMATAGDTLRALTEPTTSDETITTKVRALTDRAVGAVAPRARTLVTSLLPDAPAVPDLSPDERGTGRSDEACPSFELHNGESRRRPSDQQEDGCVAEPSKSTKQLRQARRMSSK